MSEEVRPVITAKTTLDELQQLGADTLSDIPTVELLEFIRNQCLSVAKDAEDDGGGQWQEMWSRAAESVQKAIDCIDKAMKANLED